MRSRLFLPLLALAALLPAALPAGYRIEVKGGGIYWSAQKPAVKGNSYTFKTSDGTLLLLRKSDVVSVTESAPPKKEKDAVDIGWSSPADAARARAGKAPVRGTPKSDLQKNDAYRPGRGVAAPTAPDQYQVGRTLAPPPSGQVYSGEPPKMENPPPPPPPR